MPYKKDATYLESEVARTEIKVALASMGASCQDLATELDITNARLCQILEGKGWLRWEKTVRATLPKLAARLADKYRMLLRACNQISEEQA